MGLIKTAMMSGAAMYGVKQIARAAETRTNNSNSNRAPANDQDREYYEQQQARGNPRRGGYWPPEDDDYYRGPPPPPPARGARGPQYSLEQQAYWEEEADWYPPPPTQRSRPLSSPPAYRERGEPGQYVPRRAAASRQQGFVEPEEIEDDQPAASDGRTQAMMNMLLQQAMSGAGKGKGAAGELLKNFTGK